MERYSNLKYIQTTVIAVRKDDCVAMGGDGQVTVGDSVVKTTTRKVRKLAEGRVLAGFAGAAADALTLFEKFEAKIMELPENLPRASVELAKEWRTDKILRRLEALLAVADREHSLLVSGSGDVIEPDDGILAIGSGGDYALSAARALLKHTNLPADEIVKESLMIASEICIYSNDKITIEVL
ncbi:MAG TPA: ATP-dependent protease subunit HslV [Firmicutes bacterium]|nr:ATP-dependent protease subunit HslV [Bacillota bacterium]